MIEKMTDADPFMAAALEEARLAAGAQEVPVGAVVVRDGEIIARAYNRVERDNDPTAHAEMLAMRTAAQHLGEPRLADCDLYVTLEPCTMCATAISFFRIRKLVFGAYDPKGGGVEHGVKFFTQPTCHHAPEVLGGVAEAEASELLKEFFQARRD